MGNLKMPKAITAMIVVVALAWSGFVSCPTFAHGINAAQARALAQGGPLEYFKAGSIHMLTGYDHLSFCQAAGL